MKFAIRPTKLDADPSLPPGTDKLYALIKARFLASQCKPALFDRTTVWIDAGPVTWVAQGAVLVEPGYLHYWRPYARQEDEELPVVQAGQRLTPGAYGIEEKQTSPPPRYDTGALIRKLEVSGIGRPATFASIIETLLRRSYVQEVTLGRKRVLQPTDFGLQVDGLLTDAFPDLVSEGYTAAMEAELDRIEGEAGETRLGYLRRWHAEFRGHMRDALPRASRYRVAHQLAARPRAGGGGGEETVVRCDRCGEASYRKIARKKGKGSFLACPACNMLRDVRAKVKPGACPKCGSALIEKRARKGKSKFFGCVRYGAAERPCDYIEGSAGRVSREATSKPCPKCGKASLEIATPADGGAYYACPDRSCRFTLPVGSRRRAAPCPTCGGVVVERRPRPRPGAKAAGAPFWSCARYPGCSYAASMEPRVGTNGAAGEAPGPTSTPGRPSRR